MTTEISPNVRLVKCPRCRELLTELPELPLYKCGGCGTILQSKAHRNRVLEHELSLIPNENEASLIPNENEASISVLDSSPPEGRSLPGEDQPSDQGDNGNNDRERCQDRSSSDELSHIREVSDRDLEVISAQVAEESRHDEEDTEKGPNLRGQDEGLPEEMDHNGQNLSSSEIASANEKNTSVNCSSRDTEKLPHSHREDRRSFGRVSSIDTLDSSLPDDPLKRVDMSKSATIKSHYAYEGSISSYDGNDDQVRDHLSHPPRRKYKDKVSTELHKKEWLNKPASSSSLLQGRHYPAMEGSSNWHQVELPQTRRHGFKNGNRMRFDRVEEASRTPSSYQRTSLQNRQVHHSLDRPIHSEPDRMDLLRTVWELKDQLNRMQLSRVTTNRMAFSGGLSKGGPQRHKHSRMAFSGEAAHYSHQHCCPHRSAQLPSHSVLFNNDHQCNFHAYSSSSPLHYMNSDKKRFYSREKHHVTKRHLRPVSGGAPLISCHHCSALLQLPSDFLLFKKRYHQLRCNSCWKVLKISLVGGRVVPYLPETSAPPPSEVDDYNDVISHRNPFTHADPFSCSDDCGPSFRRSCSTEGDSLKTAKWRNASSEIEEVIERSNSPLHRLMGYTSPSQVLNK